MPYITVCASRVDSDDWLPVNRTIGTAHTPATHSAVNIAADVRAHCAAIGIDCSRKGVLFAATTDTAAAMSASVRELGLLWKPCDAHVLNLVLKYPFSDAAPAEVAAFSALFARVRNLINHINGSANLLQLFHHHIGAQQNEIVNALKIYEPNRTGKKRQLPRKLKTYPDTRFNYVYLSIRRLLVFFAPLQQFLLQPQVADAIPRTDRVTIDDLPMLRDLNTILAEFQSAITTMQAANYPTISTSFVTLLLLHIFLQQPILHTVNGVLIERNEVKGLRECLFGELHRRILGNDR